LRGTDGSRKNKARAAKPASRVEPRLPQPSAAEPSWGSKTTDILTEARLAGSLGRSLGPKKLLALQRTAGNRAVGQLVAALNDPKGSPALALVRARRHTTGTGRPAVQRAVKTDGGEFDTTLYTKIERDAADKKTRRIGADIRITFKAGDVISSDKIGLTQTVKAMKSEKLTGALTTRASARRGKGKGEYETALKGRGAEDVGRGIDRVVFASNSKGKESTLPVTNPMYGVPNTPGEAKTATKAAIPENASTALGDTAPGGNAHFGSRKYDAKTKVTTNDPAWLTDTPSRTIGMNAVKVKKVDVVQPTERYELTFETAAVVLAGPQENVYLGSVAWGWTSDDKGAVTLTPFGLISAGAPSKKFMAAAKKWNTLKFKDTATKTVHETVSLPITSFNHPDKIASDMSTPDLLKRATYLSKQDTKAKAAAKKAAAAKDQHAVARANVQNVVNLEFERAVVRAELRKRNVYVDLTALKTRNPKGDDTIVHLEAGKNFHLIPKTTIAKGAKSRATVPMGDLINPSESILDNDVVLHVRAYEKASAVRLFNVVWSLPLRPHHDSYRGGGARYAVSLTFDK
jgi:hypothetical protein